ncbi:MAG: copper amine oxidase N-terminal domain-containing protein, partial [Methylocystaceae bacterium]
MKKPLLMLVAALILVGLCAGVAMATPPMLLSGGETYQSDPQPFFSGDRIMAPVGAVCDLLSINPSCSETKGSITMTLSGNSLTVFGGQAKAQLNGQDIMLPLAVQTVDNFTYVPLRATIEALGATVTWNEEKQSADVATLPDNNQLMVFHAGSLAAPLRDL